MSLLERVLEQEAREEGLGVDQAGPAGQTASLSAEKALAEQRRAQRQRELRERLKSELIDRLGLQTLSKMVGTGQISRTRDELTVACQAIVNSQPFEDVRSEDWGPIITQVLDDVCGLGPLQSLLEDETVTEVMVNGCSSLFFERGGKLHASEVTFESPEQIMVVIDRILAPLGRRLDRANPIVNARLANGDRVNAVADPVAIDGPAVTIRKFSHRIIGMNELVRLGSIPAWYARLLSWAVRLRQDIAVAGGTGSGKTTLLNALSCEIGQDERIVTIEDSAELRFTTHPNVVRLEARDASIEGSGAITIRDLVKNSLRMRPDRIVVGEVRGGEAIDMLQAMNTGHDGSLTTLHSGTAEEAILRLVLMARFGMDLPADIIEEQVASALDYIVMSTRLPGGARRITSLSSVSRAQEGGVHLEECVSYDMASDSWRLVQEPAFIEQALSVGLLSREEVETWRRSLG